MPYLQLRQAIWAISTGLQAYLLALVILRRVYRRLPFFAGYLFFVFLKSVTLWFVQSQRAGTGYYLAYWVGETLAFTLAFLVIIELFSRMLEGYPAVAAFCRILLAILFAALVVSCLLLARLDTSIVGRTLFLLERSVRFVQVGLIVCWFAMASYFRLFLHPWQRAVALGYGLYASVQLAQYALLLHFWYRAEALANLIGPVAFLFAVLLWAFCLTLPVPERAVSAAPPAPELIALEAEIRRRMEEVNRALWAVLRGRQG